MKYKTIILLILCVNFNFAQELSLPVFTQYLTDSPFAITPTYAGIGNNFRIRGNGFSQWVGIKDAPRNQSIFVDSRISDRSGLGLAIYNDKNGNTKQQGFKASFAYHLILDYYSKQYLSFGISFSLNNLSFDSANFSPENPDSSLGNNHSIYNKNFDLGVLYRKDNYYISLNTVNILGKEDEKFGIKEPNTLINYQLYTGYIFRNKEYNRAEFEPSVFVQYYQSDNRSTTDLNIKYRKFNKYDDYYWIGFSYRFLNDKIGIPLAIGPMAGLKKGFLYFGYSYQITPNSIFLYNTGSHMISLGIDFRQRISPCNCLH